MFANPWALLLLLLAAPIVWLYRRRAAMPETPVATGSLWEQVFAEEPFRMWWLPRRHAVSLAVQLAILAAAVLALAQPRLSPPQTVILVVDHSAGMNATDVKPSRFEAAREHARRRIEALPAGDKLGILAGGTPVSVVCSPTGDRRLLRESLDALEPGMGKARVPEAVALARHMLPDRTPGRIAVLTDACFAEASQVAEADRVELFTVGGQPANVAVRRVAARREPGRPATAQVLVEVAGYPPVDLAEVPIELRQDGEAFSAPPAEHGAGPRPAAVYEWTSPEPGVLAVHAQYDDVLPADNRGSAAVPPAEVLDVSLVGQVNPFVEAALAANPMVRTASVDAVPAAPSPATVLVLQGEVPPRLPAGPVLVLGPRGPCDLWELDGQIEHAPVARQSIESEIMA
ncbi:MAG: vWA domain-containing protein, partial [Thermoguttaceae bacterium]